MVIKKQYEPISNRQEVDYDPEFIFEEDLKQLQKDYIKAMLSGETFVTLTLPKQEYVENWIRGSQITDVVGDLKTFDYSSDDEICSYEACETPRFAIGFIKETFEDRISVCHTEAGMALSPILTETGEEIHDSLALANVITGYDYCKKDRV